MVNHEEQEWEWQGRKYICKPGQVITSLEKIAKEAGKGITLKNVRTAIDRFQKYGFLANESTNKKQAYNHYKLGSCTSRGMMNRQANKGQATKKQRASNGQLTRMIRMIRIILIIYLSRLLSKKLSVIAKNATTQSILKNGTISGLFGSIVFTLPVDNLSYRGIWIFAVCYHIRAPMSAQRFPVLHLVFAYHPAFGRIEIVPFLRID